MEIERTFRESLGATVRPMAEIERFVAGWELLAPGLTPLSLWRPGGGSPPAPNRAPEDSPESYRALVGGVGRKPEPAEG